MIKSRLFLRLRIFDWKAKIGNHSCPVRSVTEGVPSGAPFAFEYLDQGKQGITPNGTTVPSQPCGAKQEFTQMSDNALSICSSKTPVRGQDDNREADRSLQCRDRERPCRGCQAD